MKNSFFIHVGLVALVAFSFQRIFADDFDATTGIVGRGPNGLVTPVNQLVTPAGTQVELPGIRPNALALSPDGKLLVTAGLTHVSLSVSIRRPEQFRSASRSRRTRRSQCRRRLTASFGTNQQAKLSFTGLAFSPDGSRIYLSNVNGDIKVFGVGKDR